LAADLIALRGSLLDHLAALGIDVAGVLRRAGLPSSRFQSSKANLSTREFFAFWRALDELAGSPDLGLRLGSAVELHQLSVASLAALHSPNLGEALTKLARYTRICLPEEVRIDVGGGAAKIGCHWLYTDESPSMMLIDGLFAHILALARRGMGKRLVPLRVELARRRFGEAMLKRHFGCEILFDAPVDLLVLDEAALGVRFVTRNADLYEVLLPQLEAVLQKRSMSGERPSVEKVAEAMCISPRTLQRRLTELETSYQKLLDEVRDIMARRLLLHTDLDAGEIAFLLGFDELNSFTRAFHGWEGATPVRWRQRNAVQTTRLQPLR
jgi:AraC-like DNA-binding protein